MPYGCTGPAGCVCGEGWSNIVRPPVQGVLTGVLQGDGGVLIDQVFGDAGGYRSATSFRSMVIGTRASRRSA